MRTTALAAALTATALIPPAVQASETAPATQTTRTTQVASAPRAAPVRLGACGTGQLCLWEKPDFTGARQVHELSTIDIESCVPLPPAGQAQALANRTGRPVTTYQSAECAETGEFETYPGGGTWVPQSPYRVRAFKVWEN
ncbi:MULTISPECIES: peptidase inhibitor family I36 protein [unclassified Streptomyces]|uniref:peptidase inhibitor family I36 protein n=1 Tax=unclassified Streptomyces TaxID=2593676 RepID=UPI002DD83A80|nr:peptidase inhibitor family I36 protein [Streptomyces sp. NBC_00841]WRZ99381.1 peptidase inhibitor family I36 protein [Streptomyces sp. NBC_00841]